MKQAPGAQPPGEEKKPKGNLGGKEPFCANAGTAPVGQSWPTLFHTIMSSHRIRQSCSSHQIRPRPTVWSESPAHGRLRKPNLIPASKPRFSFSTTTDLAPRRYHPARARILRRGRSPSRQRLHYRTIDSTRPAGNQEPGQDSRTGLDWTTRPDPFEQRSRLSGGWEHDLPAVCALTVQANTTQQPTRVAGSLVGSRRHNSAASFPTPSCAAAASSETLRSAAHTSPTGMPGCFMFHACQ